MRTARNRIRLCETARTQDTLGSPVCRRPRGGVPDLPASQSPGTRASPAPHIIWDPVGRYSAGRHCHGSTRYRVTASRRCRIAAPAPYGGGALRFKEPHDAGSDPVERVLPKGSEIPLDATDVDAAQLVEKRNRTARQASLSGAEARIHGRVLARPSADLCSERDNDEGWVAQRAGRTSHHDHRSLAFLFMSLRSMERKSHEKHVARGNRSLTDHAPHLL